MKTPLLFQEYRKDKVKGVAKPAKVVKSLMVVADWEAGASKNRGFFTDGDGRVRKSYKSRAFHDALVIMLKSQYQHRPWRFVGDEKVNVGVTLFKQRRPSSAR